MATLTEDLNKEIDRILSEVNQIFYDAEYWNNLHPNVEPINPDKDGVLRKLEKMLKETKEALQNTK